MFYLFIYDDVGTMNVYSIHLFFLSVADWRVLDEYALFQEDRSQIENRVKKYQSAQKVRSALNRQVYGLARPAMVSKSIGTVLGGKRKKSAVGIAEA